MQTSSTTTRGASGTAGSGELSAAVHTHGLGRSGLLERSSFICESEVRGVVSHAWTSLQCRLGLN